LGTLKVNAAFALVCGKCGARRRVLAYITEHLTEPSVVRAILVHLPSTARPIAPVRDPPQARFADLSC